MKIKRIIALMLSALMLCSVLVFTADAVATEGKPRIWACQGNTSFGATDPQNTARKNQYDAENDIVYAKVIPNNHSAAPYLAFWNVACSFQGTDPWSLTVACLIRPNTAGVTPVLVSAQSRLNADGTGSYNGTEKNTPATDADGNQIVFSEEDVGKWHTIYFRHDGKEMRYYNQYQVVPYGSTAKASAFYTDDNSKTMDIAVLAEFATDAEALAADLTSNAGAPKITLTFDAQNGSEPKRTSVVRGDYLSAKVAFPEKPTEPEGKIFVGWSTDKNASVGVSDANVPTGNTTYYAIYKSDSVDITFKNGDETTTVSTKLGAVPEAPLFTKTGYALSWDKEITEAEAPVTYTAVWTAKEYDVTFDAGEGSFAEGKTVTVKATFDTQITAPSEVPKKSGYSFIGWSPEVGVLTTEGATFTAVYEEKAPEEVAVSVKIVLEREENAKPHGNFAKLYIYSDNTKQVLKGEYELENAETEGSALETEITLTEGTYYVEIVKNGYLAYKTELTVSVDGISLKEIKLVPGDIKGDYADECGNGIIDIDDFVRVLRGFSQNASEELCIAVDINEDGDVNVADIGYIKANLGKVS